MSSPPHATLAEMRSGTTAIIEKLDMEEHDAVRLMELGFIPEMSVSCQRSVPLGDLRVYQLDGVQVAVRHETAARILVRLARG